jgi:hypothetical protein
VWVRRLGKLGNDVLSHHGVNARPLGCVLSRFIDGLCGAGVVQPARNSRHMVQALACRDCRHGTAVGVTADDDIGDAKAGDRVLNTGRDASRLHPVGRHDVSGIADDEQFARFLLCQQFRYDATVRAGNEQGARVLDGDQMLE